MTIKTKVKNLAGRYNPAANHRRKQMQKRLVNKEVSFLVPNCIGGILFHDLGLRFQSPTVNLMMKQTDFVRFVTHLDEYLQKDLVFFNHPELTCPCAMLGDVCIHFTHFNSEIEAKEKWIQRAGRIRKDNLFIFCEERDSLSEEEIRSLADIKAKGILVFTANRYEDIPYTLYLPTYHKAGEVGNILARNYFDDSREYEKYFDFVAWFNEADGKNYDVSRYSRI